jgi:hypothetical protein
MAKTAREQKCWTCKEIKPIECFGIDNRRESHLSGQCRECKAKKYKEHYNYEHESQKSKGNYARHKEKVVARQMEYLKNRKKTEEGKKQYLAHQLVAYYKRNGLIKPEPCNICGKKAEAHHPDYRKPLEVIWLCSKHHKEMHNEKSS